MFDLYTGNVRHLPRNATLPILVSTSAQATALALTALMSFLIVTRELPAVPDVLAFVAELPAAVSGVVGSVPALVEAPPPPPLPAPISHEPVRIGGQLSAPALVKRVEPLYPVPDAVRADSELVVPLRRQVQEALVSRGGVR